MIVKFVSIYVSKYPISSLMGGSIFSKHCTNIVTYTVIINICIINLRSFDFHICCLNFIISLQMPCYTVHLHTPYASGKLTVTKICDKSLAKTAHRAQKAHPLIKNKLLNVSSVLVMWLKSAVSGLLNSELQNNGLRLELVFGLINVR